MGFSLPRRLHDARCALTAPFHPYRDSREPRRSAFLWHYPSDGLSTFCPRVSPAKPELRGIAPDGVRTFLIWLAPKAILRPSKTNPSLHDKFGFNKPASDDDEPDLWRISPLVSSKLVEKQHRCSNAAAGVQCTPGAESEGSDFHVDESEQQVAVFVERDGSGSGTVMVARANRQ